MELEKKLDGTEMDMKTAICSGDAEALRRLLAEDASLANALIHWGGFGCTVQTHPLHIGILSS